MVKAPDPPSRKPTPTLLYRICPKGAEPASRTTGVMAMVKQRVRELDAMELEPDDGRLAVKEKYTILATVAMGEVEEEMRNPKAQRVSQHASPRTSRRSARLAARDRPEDDLARVRLADVKPMDFEDAHRPVVGEGRQRSRVAYASKVKDMPPTHRLVTYGAGRIPSNKIEYFSKTDPMAHGSVAVQRRRSPRGRGWGGVAVNTYRTPERRALTFNSPGAPVRGNPKFSGGSGSGGGARRRGHDRPRVLSPAKPQLQADKGEQMDPPFPKGRAGTGARPSRRSRFSCCRWLGGWLAGSSGTGPAATMQRVSALAGQ